MKDFHLIDLVSQAAAVQRVLVGKSDEEKLSWLANHGRLERIETRVQDAKPTYSFESSAGRPAIFFLDGDRLIFIGDHHTFSR